MKNTQRGFIPLLFVILAVVVIGGGAYFVTNNKVNTPEQKEVTDETVKEDVAVREEVKSPTSPEKIVKKEEPKTNPQQPISSELSHYSADLAEFGFDYDGTIVKVNSYGNCIDPKNILSCRGEYRNINISSKIILNHGDYSAPQYEIKVVITPLYNSSTSYSKNSSTFETIVEGFKANSGYYWGRGWSDPVTKIEERTTNGQKAVVIYRANHISDVIFQTKPYKNSISFIGMIHAESGRDDQFITDKLITTLMDSWTEKIQEIYMTKFAGTIKTNPVADENVKNALLNFRTIAQAMYSKEKTYTNACASGYINQQYNAELGAVANQISSAAGVKVQGELYVVCYREPERFVIALALSDGTSWCVDSAGASKAGKADQETYSCK